MSQALRGVKLIGGPSRPDLLAKSCPPYTPLPSVTWYVDIGMVPVISSYRKKEGGSGPFTYNIIIVPRRTIYDRHSGRFLKGKTSMTVTAVAFFLENNL